MERRSSPFKPQKRRLNMFMSAISATEPSKRRVNCPVTFGRPILRHLPSYLNASFVQRHLSARSTTNATTKPPTLETSTSAHYVTSSTSRLAGSESTSSRCTISLPVRPAENLLLSRQQDFSRIAPSTNA